MTATTKVQAARETSPGPDKQQNPGKTRGDASGETPLAEQDPSLPLDSSPSFYSEAPRVVWDWVCWSGAKTFDGMDFAGEVIADFLGLTRSKYQWVLDLQEREEEEKRQRRLEARQRRQLRLEQLLEEEQRKLQELEDGAFEESSGSTPAAGIP